MPQFGGTLDKSLSVSVSVKQGLPSKITKVATKLATVSTTKADSSLTSIAIKKKSSSPPEFNEEKLKALVKASSEIQYAFGSNMTKIDPLATISVSTSEKETNDRLIYKVRLILFHWNLLKVVLFIN
jgi:phage FluMu gp28-like protein